MKLPGAQLSYIRSKDPKLAELLQAFEKQSTQTELQSNTNPLGEPPVPPPPDALSVTTGPSGEFQVAITHNAEFNRGITYTVQSDSSPSFSNPHDMELGHSRNDNSLNLPGQTLHFRVNAAYRSGAPSAWTYHGTQQKPTPVEGGIPGQRAPGMGSGTGAPASVSGPGPIQSRFAASGYNYKAQVRTPPPGFIPGNGTPAGRSGFALQGSGTPSGSTAVSESVIAASEWLISVAGTNTITAKTATPYQAIVAGFAVRMVPANTNSGATTLNVNGAGAKAVTKNGTTALASGELQAGRVYVLEYDGTRWQIVGPSLPISALLLASDASGNPATAVLADTKIFIGQGSGLPAAQSISGDATLADTGALTLATVNPDVGTYGDSTHTLTVTVNAKGLLTAISINGIAVTGAQIIAALGYTPAQSGSNSTFSLTAPIGGGAVTGTITQS